MPFLKYRFTGTKYLTTSVFPCQALLYPCPCSAAMSPYTCSHQFVISSGSRIHIILCSFFSVFEGELADVIPVIRTSVAGCRIIGRLCVGMFMWLRFNFFCIHHCTIMRVIVSITKFSIVIGSLRAYLSCNRRAIKWVSDYRCPISTFYNWIPVIGYPCDSHVNYARFNGFLRTVSYSFQSLCKAPQTFSIKGKFSKGIFNSEICYRYD